MQLITEIYGEGIIAEIMRQHDAEHPSGQFPYEVSWDVLRKLMIANLAGAHALADLYALLSAHLPSVRRLVRRCSTNL